VPPERITVEEASNLNREGFVAMFGPVFEGSPWVAEEAWHARPFGSLSGLHAALVEAMYGAPDERRLDLIRAHPDLAGKAAIAGDLTPESTREQTSAGLDRLTPEEYEAFTEMNRAYHRKFGFPMVVCVREHTKESILTNAATRLEHAPEQEMENALAEISKIARLRLLDLVEDGEAPETEGDWMSRSRKLEDSAIVMGASSYGKSEIRLVKVTRLPDRHDLRDLTVDVTLEGDLEASYVKGDNTGLLATDTMRNTVYALAKDHLKGDVESFGLALVDRFLDAGPTVERARVRLVEHPWNRIEVNGRPHEHSFVRGAGNRIATVAGTTNGGYVMEAGIDDLLVLKTTNSGWEGFHRERYTTLPETDDRILSTVIAANWLYGGDLNLDFDRLWQGVRQRILETFTDHYSPSVQNTLFRMGEAVLEEFPEIRRIHFSLPNRHHLPYDLSRFGMENDNEIFHATSEPYGVIEGTVEREQ
jgi:urate oxidase